MSRQRMEFLVHFVVVSTCIVGGHAVAHAQSVLASVTQRPFVVGVVPVVGNGAVGGVAIDANGAIEQAEQRDVVALRDARRAAMSGLAGDITKPSELRKISLRRLDALLARHVSQNKPLSVGYALSRRLAARRVRVRVS